MKRTSSSAIYLKSDGTPKSGLESTNKVKFCVRKGYHFYRKKCFRKSGEIFQKKKYKKYYSAFPKVVTFFSKRFFPIIVTPISKIVYLKIGLFKNRPIPKIGRFQK